MSVKKPNPWETPPWTSIKAMSRKSYLTERQVRQRLGLTQIDLECLKDGKMRIDKILARKLSIEIGGTENYWLSRDKEYVKNQQ